MTYKPIDEQVEQHRARGYGAEQIAALLSVSLADVEGVFHRQNLRSSDEPMVCFECQRPIHGTPVTDETERAWQKRNPDSWFTWCSEQCRETTAERHSAATR